MIFGALSDIRILDLTQGLATPDQKSFGILCDRLELAFAKEDGRFKSLALRVTNRTVQEAFPFSSAPG